MVAMVVPTTRHDDNNSFGSARHWRSKRWQKDRAICGPFRDSSRTWTKNEAGAYMYHAVIRNVTIHLVDIAHSMQIDRATAPPDSAAHK